jgi:putative transposase
MLAERGVEVTYKAIRRWGLKFGREFANRIAGVAHVVATMATWAKWSALSLARSTGSGVQSTRRASLSDVLVQSWRDNMAAKCLLHKLLRK